MEKNITTESGLQLLARLFKRPSLLHMDDILFPGGPEPGDIVQISGQPSVGKTLLLLKFLTKSLLPRNYEGIEIGGLEAGVILINTDHHISLFKLCFLMQQFIYKTSLNHSSKEKTILNNPDKIENIIIESLKRLIILKTYSSLQLEMNFYSLEKILSGNSDISLIVIDSLTSYYWSDITNYKSFKKMDLYLKVMIEKLKNCLKDFKLVIIYVTQEYFQCKQSEYSSKLITHKIELKKNEDSENFMAYIDSQKTVYQYSLNEKGFNCSGCGYRSKFEELSAAIKSGHPDVEIIATEGRIGSFEVSVNDVLVYSKLHNLAFPDFESVVEVVKEVCNGMPPREVLKQQPRSFCTIEKVDSRRESGIGSDSDTMAELTLLLTTEIPEGRSNLADSHTNLERVAEYCEGNYFQSDNKRAALEETKNYTTQSLASVAYQINTLAYNFLQLLDLQTAQLDEMESQMNHIAQTVMIHKEKVARREIGILTATKTTSRQYKIIAPANPEKPIKYVRKPIDYNALDDIGHGVRSSGLNSNRAKQRGPSQGSIQAVGAAGQGPGVQLGPAPTTKPPTPPQAMRTGSTLSKSSREYRTPPAVAPPQVPSHYAPNYPLGHPRRERGPGYSTLPMNIGASHTLPHAHHQPPQAMVHPMSHSHGDHHTSMPAPPSPLSLTDGPVHHSHHTLPNQRSSHQQHRPGNVSPPLPPPPPPEDEHAHFGQPVGGRGAGIVPDDHQLPGWVPKNYIEKVVAIYDYYADKEDELSFQENSVIYVLKKNDDGWWEGVMDGITGLFPGNYVEACV